MNDFDYENLQKKKIARNARYKKGTRGCRGCSLPSDHLSKKEWQERNGEVVTYNLNKPINYKDFRKLPKHIQKGYIQHKIDIFKVNCSEIAIMMNVNSKTLYGHIKQLYDGSSPFSREKVKRPMSQWTSWVEFCGNTENDAVESEEQAIDICSIADTDVEHIEPEIDGEEPIKTDDCEAREPMSTDVNLSVHISGVYDQEAILQAVRNMGAVVPAGVEVDVDIRIRSVDFRAVGFGGGYSSYRYRD